MSDPKTAWLKHLKTLKFERVLLIGSAPYVPDWYEKNKDRFSDYELCAINNSWACTERLDIWFRSNDFASLASKKNPPQRVRRVVERGHLPIKGKQLSYNKPKGNGGTMLLNAIYFCLNEAIIRDVKMTLAIAGSDFDYTPETTHFYGNGKTAGRCRKQISRNAPVFRGKAADPLRYGRKWLSRKLLDTRELFDNLGHNIVNVGGHFPSLLPFNRELPFFIDSDHCNQ